MQYTIIAALFGYALLKGRAPERAAAGILLGMVIVDRIYHAVIGAGRLLTTTDLAHASLDLLACIGFVYIALYANRNYTLWLAGFQIVATLAHLARGVAEHITPIAYAIMVIAPSYFQIVILAIGIWCHQRREKRHGTYRSWRTSSPRLPGNPQLP